MEKWSPELPEETKNKFLAGELMLAYDAGYYRKVPDELKNLDRRKVKLHPHFDMTEYEIRKEIKEYNLEECKKREFPIEGLFSLFETFTRKNVRAGSLATEAVEFLTPYP